MDVILDRRVFAPGNMSRFHVCSPHRWGTLHNYVVKQQTCSQILIVLLSIIIPIDNQSNSCSTYNIMKFKTGSVTLVFSVVDPC